MRELSQSRYGGNQHYRTSTSSSSGHAMFSVPSYLGFQGMSGFAVTSDCDTIVPNLKVYEKIGALGDPAAVSALAQDNVERAYYYDRRGRMIQTVERNLFGILRVRMTRRYCRRDSSPSAGSGSE